MWMSSEFSPYSQDNTEADIFKHGLLSTRWDMQATYTAHSSDPWKSCGHEDTT